nr:hypothetical protein [Tanacetum cinerariifolium]
MNVRKTDGCSPLMCTPPCLRAPKSQAMFGESDGGGGELDGGGCESMYSIFENGSSSGCHGGLWWLIEDEEDGEVVICIWRVLEENSLEME